jgi:hypothetical protein
MNPYSPKLVQIMNSLTDEEKIRLFYELAKYLNENMEVDEEDDGMVAIVDSIADFLNAVENLPNT